MSKHDELPVLDEAELAMLAAFQAEEAPPSAVVQDVRARVLETTRIVPPTGSIIRGPWALWGGVAVVAAAAAAVVALNMGGADATAVSQRDAQQALDTRDAHDPADQAIAKERAPATGSGRAQQVAPPPIQAPPAPEPSPSVDSPTPVAERKVTKKRRPTPSAEAPPVATAPESSLAAETRMLDRARKAVAAKRPKDALAILAEAASKFPGGVLAQERAALRVVALCDAGRLEAGRKAAASFVAAHPRSALRTRVETACPDAP